MSSTAFNTFSLKTLSLAVRQLTALQQNTCTNCLFVQIQRELEMKNVISKSCVTLNCASNCTVLRCCLV